MSVSQKSQIPLLIFAKAPIPGRVKTRLHSHCLPAQAARIAELLLEAALTSACQFWPGRVYLSSFLNLEYPALLRLRDRFGVEMHEQAEGDLGAKMHAAFEQLGYPMAIMGADAPHVPAHTYKKLHHHLARGESAIGPSIDGGYYIIGLSRSAPELFTEMPWGTSRVLQLTGDRAQKAGQTIRTLDSLNDIDEWADLKLALPELPELAVYLAEQKLI